MTPRSDSRQTAAGPVPDRAVVMGTSAGALEALSNLLPELPADFPLPVMLVVHLPADKESILPELLQSKCQVAVREAEDKEPIRGGTVYVAPPDYHLLVEREGCLSLSSEEPVQYSRPSIDVLFESAADVYGAGLIGVILTGANDDGSSGSKAIEIAGGTVLVQRPDLSQSSTMPQAALKACASAIPLSLGEIARYLREFASSVSS